MFYMNAIEHPFMAMRQDDKPSHSLQAHIHVFHHPSQQTTRIPAVDVVQSASSYQAGTSPSQRSGPTENSHLPHKHIWQSGAALLVEQTLHTHTQPTGCKLMTINFNCSPHISNN